MYKEKVDTCANRIAKALTVREMKQADLCKLAKVPKSSLSLYLSGAYEPKQNRVFDMAKVLNVSEAWILGYDVPMERQDGKKYPSDKSDLSEGEILWLELYNRVSGETRELLVKMMESFDRIPPDKQKLVLHMIRAALGNQE